MKAELEFDWQETTVAFDEGLYPSPIVLAGANCFVRYITDLGAFSLHCSHDGILWHEVHPEKVRWNDSFMSFQPKDFYYINQHYIATSRLSGGFYYSNDLHNWNIAVITKSGPDINKIIWTGEQYVLVGEWDKVPAVYTTVNLPGPWQEKRLPHIGGWFDDIAFINPRFIITGRKSWDEYEPPSILSGIKFTDLKQMSIPGDEYFTDEFTILGTSLDDRALMAGANLCFLNVKDANSLVTADGLQWQKLPFGLLELVDTGTHLIASLRNEYEPIGIYTSRDGIHWTELNTPLQQGNLAWLNGKLLIVDGNKIAIGTYRKSEQINETLQ